MGYLKRSILFYSFHGYYSEIITIDINISIVQVLSSYFLDFLISCYYSFLMEKKMLSTLINNTLLKDFKKLAIDLERPMNDILEEAMRDLLKKYQKTKK